MELGLILVLTITALILASIAGYVGTRSQGDGPGTLGVSGMREGKTGEVIMSQCHGKYYEATSRGNVYGVTFLPGTGLTPYTNSGALGTAPSWSLQNPKGSGKRLKLIKVSVALVSGTIGVGSLYHCVNNNVAAAATTGTSATPTNMDVGNANNAVGQPLYTATLPATPTPLYPVISLSTNVGFFSVIEDINGLIVLEPGTTWSLEPSPMAAGTSPLLNVGIVWEEIPIV